MFWFLLQLENFTTLRDDLHAFVISCYNWPDESWGWRNSGALCIEHDQLWRPDVSVQEISVMYLPTYSIRMIVIVLMIHREILYCGLEYLVFAMKVFTNLIPRDSTGANTLKVSHSVDIFWLVI